MTKIQVTREIKPQDKTVIEAFKIAKDFKVLPYPEVTKRLDKIASDYSLVKAK